MPIKVRLADNILQIFDAITDFLPILMNYLIQISEISDNSYGSLFLPCSTGSFASFIFKFYYSMPKDLELLCTS